MQYVLLLSHLTDENTKGPEKSSNLPNCYMASSVGARIRTQMAWLPSPNS